MSVIVSSYMCYTYSGSFVTTKPARLFAGFFICQGSLANTNHAYLNYFIKKLIISKLPVRLNN